MWNDSKKLLLESVKSNIKDPFLVLDQNGNVILYNNEAEGLLSLDNKQVNIFDLLVEKSAESFNQLFQKLLKNNSSITETVLIELNSGNSFHASITLNSFMQKDEIILLLTLKPESYNYNLSGKTKLEIRVNELERIINNKRIIEILNEVKRKYPFTFVGKETIRKQIDEITEYFWIKDINGTIAVVNKNVSRALKLKSSQIEGKNESVFIPPHLNNFQTSLTKFIVESLNYIVLNDAFLFELNNPEEQETIEIPLCDSSNNVIAIVNIIQNKKIAVYDVPVETEKPVVDNINSSLETLLDNNPIPIIIVDEENLNIINANKKALELYGYEKAELLEKDISDIYSTEDMQLVLGPPLMNSDEKNYYGPIKHRKKNGSEFFVKFHKIQFKQKDKSLAFYLIEDITQALYDDVQNKINQSVYANSNDLILLTDSTGFIKYINKKTEETLGYKKEDILDSAFSGLLPNDERTDVNRKIFASNLHDAVSLNLSVRKENDEYTKFSMMFSPIYDYKGELANYVINGQSVEPVVSNEQLELGAMREESPVVDTNSGEDFVDFIGKIFHEILTPVNVILGFVDEFGEKETGDDQEMVDIVRKNRYFLTQAMNSSAELSKLRYSAPDLKISEVKITQIVDRLTNDFNKIKENKDIEFGFGKISSSLSFKTDKDKFFNLIYNLLLIITHLTKEKKVYISASVVDNENFSVFIRDNYSSMSAQLSDELKSIFFNKDLSRVKNLGISKMTVGLAVRLIEILSCKVKISNAENNKADVSFDFPFKLGISTEQKAAEKSTVKSHVEEEKVEDLSPETNEKVEQPSSESHVVAMEDITHSIAESSYQEDISDLDLNKLKCLYVEDQIDSQVLFKIEMKKFDKIDFALAVEEALPMLELNQYDVIFIDINLASDLNGLDALRLIRRIKAYEKVPIVAVSAYLIPGDKEKYIAAGFDDFISKPLVHKKVIESLSKVFKDLISS